MAGALLPILLKPSVLGGIAIAGLGLAVWVQSGRLDNAKKDQIDQTTHIAWRTEEIRDSKALKLAQINYATCQANEATLNATLSSQEAAVEALKAEGIQSSQRATKAAHDALIATENATKLAQQVMQPSGDHSCSAAETLINRSLVQ